jgi:hypothetical protein
MRAELNFHSAEGAMLCVLDYSSEDGEHGFGLVKGQWTADSKYFVFSLRSSGGHQALPKSDRGKIHTGSITQIFNRGAVDLEFRQTRTKA